MSIEVRLFATLRKERGKKVYFNYEEGLTAERIIEKLSIDKKDVAILLINGRDGDFNTELVDKDIVSIFPPVGGG